MHLHKPAEEEKIKETFKELTGKIKQLPPIKSAVKRVLREREIYYTEILDIYKQDVLFKIGCQAGTYIRKFCVSGDTNIITNPAGCIKIKDLVDKEFGNAFYGSKTLTQQHCINSWKNNKLIKSNILKVQKLPSPKKLYLIKIQSGIELKVTPDHEIMVDSIDGAIWKKSRDITEKDYIYSPRKIETKPNNLYIIDMLDENILIADKKIINLCKKAIKNKFNTLFRGLKRLDLLDCSFYRKKNSGIRIRILKKICDNTELKWGVIKKDIRTFKGRKGLIIKLKNKKIDNNIAYMLGFLMSDGHIGKTDKPRFIRFFNKDKKLIEFLSRIHKQEFRISLHKKTDKFNLIWLSSGNFVLAQIANYMGIKSKKKESDIIKIINLPKNLIANFIKAYFDGDGSCFVGTENKNSRSSITISTKYYNSAKSLYMLLKRLNIRSRIEKTNKDLSGRGYIVSISTKSDKTNFIKIVGSNHATKIKKFKILREKLGEEYSGDSDLISLRCAKLLKNLRANYKIKRNFCGEVYCRLEKGKIRPERKTVKNIIRRFKKYKIISGDDANLKELENITKGDFYLERVSNKRQIHPKEKFVYDITVENAHNFCPEGAMVVKNCHDFGLRLGTRGHMQQLIRIKAGPFKIEDSITLHDLKDAYEFYKQENEKEIRKCILPVETAIEHLPKIWVFDTTVDSLCHGAQLSLPGISKLNSHIKENGLVAVLTLKGELICIGTAMLNSEEILKSEKGLAVKVKKVFMKTGTYPKYKKSLT